MPEVVSSLLVAAEGQFEAAKTDVDDTLGRAAADVAVGGQREAHIEAPALPHPDLVEEELDVGSRRLRHAAGEHVLEVALRQLVPAGAEEGARQLQPHPHQRRLLDEHGVEGTDGVVQQRLALVLVEVRLLRCLGRREAEEEDHVGGHRAGLHRRPQDGERVGEAAGRNQHPRLRLDACGGSLGKGRLGPLVVRAPGRRNEREAGGDRERAEERDESQDHDTEAWSGDRKRGWQNLPPSPGKFEPKGQGLMEETLTCPSSRRSVPRRRRPPGHSRSWRRTRRLRRRVSRLLHRRTAR